VQEVAFRWVHESPSVLCVVLLVSFYFFYFSGFAVDEGRGHRKPNKRQWMMGILSLLVHQARIHSENRMVSISLVTCSANSPSSPASIFAHRTLMDLDRLKCKKSLTDWTACVGSLVGANKRMSRK
jgi:hypothetical protein